MQQSIYLDSFYAVFHYLMLIYSILLFSPCFRITWTVIHLCAPDSYFCKGISCAPGSAALVACQVHKWFNCSIEIKNCISFRSVQRCRHPNPEGFWVFHKAYWTVLLGFEVNHHDWFKTKNRGVLSLILQSCGKLLREGPSSFLEATNVLLLWPSDF